MARKQDERNAEALQNARNRADEMAETAKAMESVLSGIPAAPADASARDPFKSVRRTTERDLRSARNKRDHALATIERLSKSPEERDAEAKALAEATVDAHDTGRGWSKPIPVGPQGTCAYTHEATGARVTYHVNGDAVVRLRNMDPARVVAFVDPDDDDGNDGTDG